MSAAPRSSFGKARPRPRASAVRPEGPAPVFRIAGVQMASGPNIAANLNEAKRLIEIAAEQGAKLIALPEYFAIMGLKDTDKVDAREREGQGQIQRFLADTARRLKVWLLGCSVPLESPVPGKVYNALLAYDDAGRQVGRYDKIHLFSLSMGDDRFSESRTIHPGSAVQVIESPFGRIGLSICYDVRFPELYRAMGTVDIIVVPAAFTEKTGRAHWEALIRARAIENLAYVVAPAQGGYHMSGRETHGHSMIVDPWGVVLDRLPRGSGIVIAGVNPGYQASLRQGLPALEHRMTVKAPAAGK
jgi:nitrilase